MSDVELVIKISESRYRLLQKQARTNLGKEKLDEFAEVVLNGIPLPKGHGRLIDADEAVQRICGLSCGCTVEECGYEVPCFSVQRINSAPTIIDKEQES